jgi:pimeloyl-ACP methyl ester carboxylesterase
MKLAFWPGLGGGATSLAEVGPVLALRGIESVTLDPLYGRRDSWDLEMLAGELAATAADAYAGHSWGAAVAARAAVLRPPAGLVLLDGGYVSPAEFPSLGSAETLDERVAEIREIHGGYRWPTAEAYLTYIRSESPRWTDEIEAMALEGMRHEEGEVLPPFDAEELEEIVRGYDAFDAAATLAELPDRIPTLLVMTTPRPEHVAAREALLQRFAELVPRGTIKHVDSPHDVVWGLGPALGELVADWLEAEELR